MDHAPSLLQPLPRPALATADESAELARLLVADPAVADAWARLIRLETLLEENLRARPGRGRTPLALTAPFAAATGEDRGDLRRGGRTWNGRRRP